MTISATTQGLRPGVCTSTSRPSSPFDGMMIYETDTNLVRIWNGTAWKTLAYSDYTNGMILQVASVTKTDTFSVASSTFTDVTGLSVTISPTSTTSKILVMSTGNMMYSTALSETYIRLARGGTGIAVGDASGSRPQVGASVTDAMTTQTMIHLDSPNTISATTYTVQIRSNTGTTVYFNRTFGDANNSTGLRNASSITVMEIAA